jgi:hypothetical protein
VLLSATTYNNINIGGGATGLSEGKLTVVSNNLQSPSLVLADSQSYSATTRGTDLQFWGKYTSGGNTIQFASIKGKKENATINDFSGMLQFSTRTNTSAITDRFTINGNGDMMFGNFSDFKHQTQTDFTRLQYGKLFSMVYSKNDDVSWIGGMVFMKNLYQTPAYGYDKFIQTGYAHKLIMDVNGYTFRITSGAKDADDTTSTPLGTFKFTQNRNFCVNTNEINAVSAGKVQIAVLSAVGGVTTSAYTTMGFVSTGTVTTSADKGISGVNGYIRIYDNGRTRYIPTYNVIPGS